MRLPCIYTHTIQHTNTTTTYTISSSTFYLMFPVIVQSELLGNNSRAASSSRLPSLSSADDLDTRTFMCIHDFEHHQQQQQHKQSLEKEVFHQLGVTRLLSDNIVCWHKMTSKVDKYDNEHSSEEDYCSKCGQLFYTVNKFSCDSCGHNNTKTMLNDNNIDSDDDSIEHPKYNVNSSNSNNVSNTLDRSMMTVGAATSVWESAAIELTKQNFDNEFASLIYRTLSSSFELSPSSTLLPSSSRRNNEAAACDDGTINDLTSISLLMPISPPKLLSTDVLPISNFSNKDLIEQITLFNKYNVSKQTFLEYQLMDDDELTITGQLRIHWNLKSPIRIAADSDSSPSKKPSDSCSSSIAEEQTSFKATSISSLRKEHGVSSFDDDYSASSSTTNSSTTNVFRSHTVKCTAPVRRRPMLPQLDKDKQQNEMFLPAYASITSVRIDSKTTCSQAIQILLDKFQILTPSNCFSLYKIYQSGDSKELDDSDLPLMQRLWMGPFSEDKLFIMEKGRQLAMSQEINNLVCLPDSLLKGLLTNLKREEERELEKIRHKYTAYSKELAQNKSHNNH